MTQPSEVVDILEGRAGSAKKLVASSVLNWEVAAQSLFLPVLEPCAFFLQLVSLLVALLPFILTV